jgi:hypothetical protein
MLDWKEVAAWIGWIAASLMALVTGILAHMGRDVMARVKHLEDTSVKKQDLRDLEVRLNQQTSHNHAENSDRLKSIETGIRETHGRIDDLYRDLVLTRNGR